MRDERDRISDAPEMIRDQAYRQEPALQEYDWAREQQRQRRVPIEIINSILAEQYEHEEDEPMPN